MLETRLLYLSAHLAAGHTQVKLRTQDFARIATGVLKYVRRRIRMCMLCVLYVCRRLFIISTIIAPTKQDPRPHQRHHPFHHGPTAHPLRRPPLPRLVPFRHPTTPHSPLPILLRILLLLLKRGARRGRGVGGAARGV